LIVEPEHATIVRVTRHKWLLTLIAAVIVASVIPTQIMLHSPALEIVSGVRVSIFESAVLLERAGQPAQSVPLFILGMGLTVLLTCIYMLLTFRSPQKPGGFEVKSDRGIDLR